MSETLPERFARVRADSVRFCAPLAVEDFNLQAMANASPPKWHLAHTTWFFETFILKEYSEAYEPWHPDFEVLFNSYYNAVGPQHPRPERGLLSRPTLDTVMAYRAHVEEQIAALLAREPEDAARIAELVELGTHHEQQHQELFFTDIKYSLSRNPLFPAYQERQFDPAGAPPPIGWIEEEGGECSVGYCGLGFCFDNELPVHRVLLKPYALADRLVTNGEYLEFIEDGGYGRAELWLSDGWSTVNREGWRAPLYWVERDGKWLEYTLCGLQPLDPGRPVVHVSAYEADAYARWAGARLPSEFEWETVAGRRQIAGQFVDSGEFHPCAARGDDDQLLGTVWEWTASAYSPYPGYAPAAGAVGEYNGKFMANQLVLRGGSCVTAADHMRHSYRNFFYPPDRWQFSGIRLARWL